MFVKSILAVAAISSVIGLASVPAKADPQISVGIGLGFGGYDSGYGGYNGGYGVFDGGYDDYGYGDDYSDDYPRQRFHQRRVYETYAPARYGVSCNTGRNIVRSSGYRNVRAYDCSAPTYGYKASRDGDLYQVKVSSRGRIISARPLY